jgi:hypothetical protein
VKHDPLSEQNQSLKVFHPAEQPETPSNPFQGAFQVVKQLKHRAMAPVASATPCDRSATCDRPDREAIERLLALAQAQVDISARQVAELKVLLAEGTYQPEQEWISLKTAEHEYGIVNKTARRWAKELGLGCLNGRGQWELSRSRVRAFLARTARPR